MSNRIYQSPDVYSVLSNRLVRYYLPFSCHITSFTCRQLTTVSALQLSLDSLRKHRPDYTPRTGFVWPVVDPTLSEDTQKKAAGAESNLMDTTADSQAPPEKRTEAPKRQKNNMLLLNAMRTTAVHSKMSFTTSSVAPNTETEPDTPVTTTIRSSATPAPIPPEPAAKGSTTQEIIRGQPGAGKKKKKRMHIAASHTID